MSDLKGEFQLSVFNKEDPTDVSRLSEMFDSHGLDPSTIDIVSDSGFSMKKDGIIMGAAFLYVTNSPVGYIDLFVIDKNLKREARHFVIEHLLAAIVATAIEWGVKYLIAEPRFHKSEKRLKQLGFTEFKPGSYIMRF